MKTTTLYLCGVFYGRMRRVCPLVLLVAMHLFLLRALVSAEGEDLSTKSLEELLNTRVSAASTEVKTVREAPAAVYVITEDMMRDRGYLYLYDALRDAPGFDITWMGGLYGPILSQHGVDTPENNKLILMIDGVVDNNLSAGTAQIYMQYSLHDVKRIEILYGPASALYGANAMTGLINIITKTGEDLKGITVEAGSMVWDPQFRRLGRSADVAMGRVWEDSNHKKIDVAGAFHIVDTPGPTLKLHSDEARSDLPDDPAAANYYFSPDYIGSAEVGTYMAQGRATIESLGLTFGGDVWQHNGGQGTYGHEGFVFLNGFQNKPDTWNFWNGTAFLNYTRPLQTSLKNNFNFIYRGTRLLDDSYDAYFTTPGTGPYGPGAPGVAGSRYFRPDHSVKFDDNLKWNISPKMDLTAGGSAELMRVSDYQLSTGYSFDNQILLDEGTKPVVDKNRLYDYNDYSGYVEHNWDVSSKWTLTTGMRLDVFRLTGDQTPTFFGTKDVDANGNCLPDAPDCKTQAEADAAGASEISGVYYIYSPYDRTRTTVNPRIGAVYTVSPKKLTLKMLYGEGFRMPTVRELFSVTGSRFSNPALSSEKIRTAELSTIYEIRERGYLDLDVFYTVPTDIIQLSSSKVKRPGRSSVLNQFQNVGRARIFGFDLAAQIKAAENIDLFGYYSFLNPRYTSINETNLSHVPDTENPKDASDRIPRQATNKATLGASFYWWNRRMIITPRINIVGERPSIITSSIQDVSAYGSFNISAVVRDLGWKGLWVQGVLYNVTNADILDPGFRTANKVNDFPAAHPQPGVHLFLNVGYEYKF